MGSALSQGRKTVILTNDGHVLGEPRKTPSFSWPQLIYHEKLGPRPPKPSLFCPKSLLDSEDQEPKTGAAQAKTMLWPCKDRLLLE